MIGLAIEEQSAEAEEQAEQLILDQAAAQGDGKHVKKLVTKLQGR